MLLTHIVDACMLIMLLMLVTGPLTGRHLPYGFEIWPRRVSTLISSTGSKAASGVQVAQAHITLRPRKVQSNKRQPGELCDPIRSL